MGHTVTAGALSGLGKGRPRRALRWAALAAGALVALAVVFVVTRPNVRPGVIRSLSLGPVADAVAVDEATGRAFVVSDDVNQVGSVTTIDVGSGLLVGRTRVGALPSAVAVDERTQRVFVANENSASVSMIDARSGRVLRTVIPGCAATVCTPAMGEPPATLAIDTGTGRVFVGGAVAGGVTSVLDARNGATLRVFSGSAGGLGGGPLAVDARQGRVYAPGTALETRMSVFDARSGLYLGAIPIGLNARAVAVDEATGRIFVLSDAGLGIVDAASEQLLGTRPISGAARIIQVDAASGNVVIADAAGTGLGAYDGHQARPLWSALGGVAVYGVAVDSRRAHIVVTAADGVYVLDARSGTVLRRITVDGTPGTVAVDERSGHAIVVSFREARPAADPWAWLPPLLRRWLPRPRPPSSLAFTSSINVLDTSR